MMPAMQTATDITDHDRLPARLPRGFQLEDCMVDGWLRDGGMAAIYRAHRVSDGRRVALKLQLPSTAHDAATGARFDREAELMRRVGGDPHVVELFDAGVLADGRRYLVMEWVDGEDLEELLDYLRNEDQRLPIPRACRIARDIARGLAALHEHRVVHLDLKPANVMIGRGEDGHDLVKLVDFGIADDLRAPSGRAVEGAPGSVMGTSSYMCPQQVRGEPAEPSFDVYALGVLLFEALTGSRVPPDGWTPETLPKMQTLRRGVPRAVAELVRSCMDFDVVRRPATAKVVIDGLAVVLADASASASAIRSSSEEIPVRTGGTEVVPRSKVSSAGHWVPARGGTEVARTHQEVLSSSGIGVPPLAPEAVAAALERIHADNEAARTRKRAWVRWGAVAAGVVMVGLAAWVVIGSKQGDPEERALAASGMGSAHGDQVSGRGGALANESAVVAHVIVDAPNGEEKGHADAPADEAVEPSIPTMATDAVEQPARAASAKPMPTSTGKVTKAPKGSGALKEACRTARAEASEAQRVRDWRKVLQATHQRSCWTGYADERTSLRVAAFAELGEPEACVKESRGRRLDADTKRRAKFCEKRLEQKRKGTGTVDPWKE